MFDNLSPEIKGFLAFAALWLVQKFAEWTFTRVTKKYDRDEEAESKSLSELIAKVARIELDFIKHQTETQQRIHAINNEFTKSILHFEKNFDEMKNDIKGVRDLIIKTFRPKE